MYFPAFELNIEIYFVNLRLLVRMGDNTDQKNTDYRHFLCSVPYTNFINFTAKICKSYKLIVVTEIKFKVFECLRPLWITFACGLYDTEMSHFFEWTFIFMNKPSRPFSGLKSFSNLEGSFSLMIKLYNPSILILLWSLKACKTS